MTPETKNKLKLSIFFTGMLIVLSFLGYQSFIFYKNNFTDSLAKMNSEYKDKNYKEALRIGEKLIKENKDQKEIAIAYKIKHNVFVDQNNTDKAFQTLIESKKHFEKDDKNYCEINEQMFFEASSSQMDVNTIVDEIDYSMTKCESHYSKEALAAFYPLIGFKAFKTGDYDKALIFKEKNDKIDVSKIKSKEIKEFNMKFRETVNWELKIK